MGMIKNRGYVNEGTGKDTGRTAKSRAGDRHELGTRIQPEGRRMPFARLMRFEILVVEDANAETAAAALATEWDEWVADTSRKNYRIWEVRFEHYYIGDTAIHGFLAYVTYSK